MKGLIFNIQRFSINDGPGIRTTVFFKGCPLRCRWCHNPESISPTKQLLLRKDRCIECGDCATVCTHSSIELLDGSYQTNRERCMACGDCAAVCVSGAREIVGREMTVGEVMSVVLRDRPFYEQSGGGVTFSGGEPLLQHEFLLCLLNECRRANIHAAVDTSGYASPRTLDRIAPYVDLFLFDLKSLDDGIHREWTGVSNAMILDNLKRLAAANRRIIVRIPLVPGINDDPESIDRTGRFVGDLGSVSEIHLLPYHATGQEKYVRLGMHDEFRGRAGPSLAAIDRVVRQFERYGGHVLSGG